MKMKILTALVVTMVMVSSCVVGNNVVPSKAMVSDNFTVGQVTGICVGWAIEVDYIQDDKTEVSVTCPDNLIDYLVVGVKDGVLTAGFKQGLNIKGNSGIRLRVSSPELFSIEASSSARVNIKGDFVVADKLSIDASSSAGVYIASLYNGDVAVVSSSSSCVEIGKVCCRSITAESSSSARIDLSGVVCDRVTAEASSAAMISVSGRTGIANFEASSAAAIDASKLVAKRIVRAKSSSAASIQCGAAE